jgi:hypothetical protein
MATATQLVARRAGCRRSRNPPLRGQQAADYAFGQSALRAQAEVGLSFRVLIQNLHASSRIFNRLGITKIALRRFGSLANVEDTADAGGVGVGLLDRCENGGHLGQALAAAAGA